jgi:hypothetical protein
MKKLLVVVILTITGFIGARAQSGFHFGAGINLGLPIGDFGDFQSFGVGVEAQGEYMFSEKFSGIANTGYTSFFGKDVDFGGFTVKSDAVGLIPILAGVRVYPATQFFIGVRAGLGILTGSGTSESAFAYRPEIGYNAGSIQVALHFDGLSKNGSSLNYIGLTGIYVFGGGAK